MIFAQYIDNPKYRTYIIAIIIAAIVSALGAGSFFIYKYYLDKKSENATFKLAQIIDEYRKSSSLNEVKDLIQIIESTSKNYKNNKLYPFFISYESDLELKEANEKEAIKLSDEFLKLIDEKNPLYYSYAIKNAFLKLDSKDSHLNSIGYKELNNLANNVKNPLQDMVIYNLALYELFKSNKEQAKLLFEKIVLKNKESSFWYIMAKSRLESL